MWVQLLAKLGDVPLRGACIDYHVEHALNESLVNDPLAPCGFGILPNLKDALDGGRHSNKHRDRFEAI